MHPAAEDLLIAAALLALLLISYEGGFRFGLRTVTESGPRAGEQIGAIQGALLGLLGLLLAFSFAAAGARFLERQDLIVQEANAIGTAYLRADLLDEPQRSDLRETLKRYTRHRIDMVSRLRAGVTSDALAEVEGFHTAMWRAASLGVLDKPAFAVVLLNPVNEVIDLHSVRIATARKRLPPLVLGLLIASSMLSVGVIGYGCGLSGGRRYALALPLIVIIWAALWVTVDLDRPRAGLMQLNDEPLRSISFG
jgi:hypothetical protein